MNFATSKLKNATLKRLILSIACLASNLPTTLGRRVSTCSRDRFFESLFGSGVLFPGDGTKRPVDIKLAQLCPENLYNGRRRFHAMSGLLYGGRSLVGAAMSTPEQEPAGPKNDSARAQHPPLLTSGTGSKGKCGNGLCRNRRLRWRLSLRLQRGKRANS